jgi:hypothetical protein
MTKRCDRTLEGNMVDRRTGGRSFAERDRIRASRRVNQSPDATAAKHGRVFVPSNCIDDATLHVKPDKPSCEVLIENRASALTVVEAVTIKATKGESVGDCEADAV